MKKFLFLGLLMLFLNGFSPTGAAAQTKRRVRLAAGAQSATLKGRIVGYDYIDYIVRADSGQTLTAEIEGTNRFFQFSVFDRQMQNMEMGVGVANWSGALPENGDYTIRVLLPRAEARRRTGRGNFTLVISIK